MSTGKIILSLVAGAAIGAGLGILFAPDKGATTRKKISRRGNEYAEELEKIFNDFIQNVTLKFERMNEEALLVAENGESNPEDRMDEVTAALR